MVVAGQARPTNIYVSLNDHLGSTSSAVYIHSQEFILLVYIIVVTNGSLQIILCSNRQVIEVGGQAVKILCEMSEV